MPQIVAMMIVYFAVLVPLQAKAPTDKDLAEVAKALRPIILGAMPKPLYEKSENWGNTTMALDRIRWHGARPQIIKAPKKDGTWKRTRVTALDPDTSLEFQLSNLKFVGAEAQTFKAVLALKVNIEYEQEVWEKGVRLLRENPQARLRIKANLDVETTIRLEKNPQSFLPDTVFRLRVTRADVSYDNLVFEHIAGMGGTGARLLGQAVRGTLKQWKPSIERELLARADRAIVKAADTREVHISLSNLLKLEAPKK